MFIFSSTISYCQFCSTSLSKQEKEQIFPLPVATALVQMSLTVLKCTYEANPKFTEDHFSFPSSSKRKQKQKLSLCYQHTEDTILPSDDGVRGGVWRVHITLFFDFRKHGLM